MNHPTAKAPSIRNPNVMSFLSFRAWPIGLMFLDHFAECVNPFLTVVQQSANLLHESALHHPRDAAVDAPVHLVTGNIEDDHDAG